MSQTINEGTAAAALAAHSKDTNPSGSRAGQRVGAGGNAIDDFMESAAQVTSEAAGQLSGFVRERPLVAILAVGAAGLLVGLAVGRR